jgi:methionine synthase II (cobalamin-independent)
MSKGDVHLVGSVPLKDAAEVFTEASAALGGRLRRIPDGETGPRLRWILALEPVFADHPAFEKTEERYVRSTAAATNWFQYQVREDVNPETIEFRNLPDVAAALASYEIFRKLKKERKIKSDVKFQVALATAFSIVRVFVVERHQHIVEPRYTEALKQAVQEICNQIPHSELAIQWDVASGVFERLERGETGRFGNTADAVLQFFARNVIDLGSAVPASVDLVFHLCYGDNNHKHTIEPSSTAIMVDFVNYVEANIRRSVQLYHMPAPRDRSDDKYFAPLQDLHLKTGAEIALGLVHMTDGLDGTMNRVRVARKFLPSFLVATECGFGRRPPAQVPALFKLHADVAARVAAE